MIRVLFAAGDEGWERWREPLDAALAEAGIAADVAPDHLPESVDYVVLGGVVDDFRPFVRAKAILGTWAGVERIAPNPTLTQPLTRMVEPGMTAGMVDYVAAHVLRHHVGLDADVLRAPGDWTKRVPPLAAERRVGVLGLGELGGAAASALARHGFDVAGWSRRPKSIDGVACRSGDDGLSGLLRDAEILVLLLPLTQETETLLDARRLALLPPGAVIVNPARGGLIDDDALLAALDSGALGHATLDVFRDEPLPEEHPFWAHPNVTVTPHIASATRPGTAARVIAENVRRGEAGEPLLHLVDRHAGY
jgi:glyoxylate/hydroxypyruvate reductase A